LTDYHVCEMIITCRGQISCHSSYNFSFSPII